MPKLFSKYLGYFYNKICCRELSKIAKSGHAVPYLHVDKVSKIGKIREKNYFLIFAIIFLLQCSKYIGILFNGFSA